MNREALLHVYESPVLPRALRPDRAMAAILAGSAAALGLLGLLFPSAIPALAATWMVAAAAIGVAASLLRMRIRSEHLTARDVAGAVMFVGCSAAALIAAEGLL